MRKNRTQTRHLLTWLLGIALVAASGVKAQGLVTPSSVTIPQQSNKPSTDINWSLVISVLALAVSGGFAWKNSKLSQQVADLTTLSTADIRFLVARRAYGAVRITPEGKKVMTLILPITFYNSGAQNGTVHNLNVAIDKSTKIYHRISWNAFAKYDGSIPSYIDTDVAQPILVSGRSSENKYIKFDHIDSPDNKLVIDSSEVEYTLTILVWTEPGHKPQLMKKINFTFVSDAIDYWNEPTNGFFTVYFGQSNVSDGPMNEAAFRDFVSDASEVQ